MRIKDRLDEALCFYKRNIWLTGICFIFLLFSCVSVFFGGIGAICQSLACASILLTFILFFRLGCYNRHLFDIEDLITCVFQVFFMSLHHYMNMTNYYHVNPKQKAKTFGFRILLTILFIGMFMLFIKLMEITSFEKASLYPGYSFLYLVVASAVNIIVSAFLERQYRKIYGIGSPAAL